MKASVLTTALVLGGAVVAQTVNLPDCAVSADFAPFSRCTAYFCRTNLLHSLAVGTSLQPGMTPQGAAILITNAYAAIRAS
jgi:hypothetical protein